MKTRMTPTTTKSQTRTSSGFYVRTPEKEILPGVRTFYVPSSDGSSEYTIKHTWARSGTKCWACNCPDFFHRHAVAGGTCRHIEGLKAFIADVGGLRRIPRGVKIGNITRCTR